MTVDDLIPLAAALGGRIHPGEYLNANVGEPAHGELRARRRGLRVSVRPSESRVEVDLHGFDTAVSFSVNLPDRICLLNEPLDLQPFGAALPVFVGSLDHAATVAWLQVPAHVSLVANIELRGDESLQVYRNGAVLIGWPHRATPETIERMCDLVEALRVRADPTLIDNQTFDPERIPPELRPLEPLVRRFAVGDDTLRCEVLAEAPPESRGLLRREVTPLLPRIDAFLDSFGDRPLSSEAILLGNLAEAVRELDASEA